MPDRNETIYRVREDERRFAVVDDADRVIVVCRDQGSAQQYVSLLNEVFRKGFKAGYREGKSRGKSSNVQ